MEDHIPEEPSDQTPIAGNTTDESTQPFAEIGKLLAKALREAYFPKNEVLRVQIQDPGPIARRLFFVQLLVSFLVSLVVAIVTFYGGVYATERGVKMQAITENTRRMIEARQQDCEKAASWAANGRTYSLRGIDLRIGVNPNECILSNLDLGADPERPGSQGADLTAAKLISQTLVSTRLVSATLVTADLSGATLLKAELQGANLIRANLRRADLSGANLSGADLRGAILPNSQLPYTTLQGANLQGANLQGTDLSYAQLQGADLRGANLTGADLHGAEYDDATIWPEGFAPPPEAVKVE
jgi:uncharacterized protein YjbI with pentapeptide repeats